MWINKKFKELTTKYFIRSGKESKEHLANTLPLLEES